MTSPLLDFTRKALELGTPREDISAALKQAGWADSDIKSALGSFALGSFPIPVPRPRPSLSAKEFFLYALLFLALYISAFHLGALIFDFINRAVPDSLGNSSSWRGSTNDSVRWNMSMLIVSFPVFAFMFRNVNAAIAKDPTKLDSRPRHWLTYLSLLLTAIIVISDVGVLVYNALGGELTLRFVLKILTVAAIAGGIFFYFLADIRKGEQP